MLDHETMSDSGPPLGTGEGFETALEHSWTWPAGVTLALLLALTLLVVSLYWRERGQAGRGLRGLLAALRLSLFGLAVWMLYGWMQFQHRTDLPDLVVIVDDSASMATVDRVVNAVQEEGATRLELAKSLLADPQSGLLEQLSGRYRVKVFRAGARRVPPNCRTTTRSRRCGSGRRSNPRPDSVNASSTFCNSSAAPHGGAAPVVGWSDDGWAGAE